MLKIYQHLIDGQWIGSPDQETIELINPSTAKPLAHILSGSTSDVDHAVAAARRAYNTSWRTTIASERGRLLMKLSDLLIQHQEQLTEIEASDVGKPLRQARADVIACARYFEFFAGACDKLTGETIPYLKDYTALTWREPLGVTAHIIPWNYPLQIIGRSIGGALAAGNACVLKPAEVASLSALYVGKLAIEAGFPPGVLNIVTGYGETVGAALAAHGDINHISFTGSVEVGRIIQRTASQHLIPVTLELGGKSPQIVFEDANLDRVLPSLVSAIIQNGGQTCSAGSRALIHKDIYQQVCLALKSAFERLIADDASKDRDLGPMISRKQADRVLNFIANAKKAGLKILAEGKVSEDASAGGFFVQPVCFADVPPNDCLAQEEIFGPVLSLIPFSDEEEAIELANGTNFGLIAGVWTKDGSRQMRMARALNCGQVFINNYGAGGGVELPFGGTKYSGYGREKGFESLYGFTALKTVAVYHGQE